MRTVRFRTFPRNAASFSVLYFSIEKLIALPTANKKEGKTRSVGVKPCQGACRRGPKASAPLPGVFTMIMKQTVIPRKTSNARNRVADLIFFIILSVTIEIHQQAVQILHECRIFNVFSGRKLIGYFI